MSKDIHQILQKTWGYSRFRPLQEDIIRSVLMGNDTMALLPTGGGKSLCFQVPALAMDGLCLVVSPLISLMKDQVEHLRARGVKAAAVFSGMSPKEIDFTLDNCVYGGYNFLYLSPERLQSDLFQERVQRMPVKLLAVDEAHCISEWGYDFRPSYMRIAQLRELVKGVPLMALTASATPAVEQDILEKLEMRQPKVFRKSFDRPNLVYGVVQEEDKYRKLGEVLARVGGSSIVYFRTRRGTELGARELMRQGLRATFYHAGLEQEERTRKQEEWMKGRVQTMVATTAFGMGIDKPDVRVVAHLDLPESLEAYYQEAGRGGRDEKRSFAVALVTPADRSRLEQRLEQEHPEPEEIKRVYHALGNYLQVPLRTGKDETFPLDLKKFCNNFSLKPVETYHSLKILQHEGYLAFAEGAFLPSRLRFEVDYQDLYKFEIKHKEYSPLIKSILRSYGNPFDQYVNIDEYDLARRVGISFGKVRQQLQALQELEQLSYNPRSTTPQITLLQHRESPRDLHLDQQHLKWMRDIKEAKLRAVTGYFFSENRCRGQMILSYFGERVTERCGHCDFCLKDKKKGAPEALLKETYQHLATAHAAGHHRLPEAVKALVQHSGRKQEQVLSVVRELIDRQYIRVNDRDEISLCR